MTFAHLSVPSRQWFVSSYGDLAEVPGVGGGFWHFRFRNGTTRTEQHYVLAAGGVGGAAELPAALVSTALQRAFNASVGRAAALTTATFSPCRTNRPVCFNDIDAARGMISVAQIGVGVAGYSAFGLNVCSWSLGPTPCLEADLTGPSNTMGLGVFAAGGVLVPLGLRIELPRAQDCRFTGVRGVE